MKNLLLLWAFLCVLATPLRAAAGPPTIAVVRIFDNGSSIDVVITRGEGKSEKVSFKGGANDERLVLSGEGYYKLFQKLYQEGYVLQSTFTSTTSAYSSFTTLLLVKPGS